MRLTIALALGLAAMPASAEVVASASHGFHVRHQVPLAAGDADAWNAFARIGEWWGKDHTYSGDSANLALSLTPGGCWCERLPAGGGVEHMRVSYVDPGKRALLTGSLGPLLFEGTSGAMDVRIEPSGNASNLILDYKVAGFAAGGGERYAPIVDKVLGEQLKRLRSFAAQSARKR